MGYQVGVSSGWFGVARDPALLGLAQKTGFIATAGVTVNQVDLESVSEFLEPRVKQNVNRMQKELGIQIGLHSEIGEQTAALESAERRVWEQAHLRLVHAVKNAADIKAIYINFHLSSNQLLQFEEARIRPFGFQYQVVSPEGKPFHEFTDKSPPAKKYVLNIIKDSHMLSAVAREPVFKGKIDSVVKKYEQEFQRRLDEYLKRLRNMPQYQSATPEVKRSLETEETNRASRETNEDLEIAKGRIYHDSEQIYDAWKRSMYAKYIMEAGEIDAYMTVASDLYENRDSLWTNIVGNIGPEEAYIKEEHAFNAAVASRYIIGHLTVKDNKFNREVLDGASVIDFAKKNNIVLCFEAPEVESRRGQTEGSYRLFHPAHAQWFVRKFNVPQVKLCIDFEHMLAQGLDPYKVIPALPGDFGKLIYLFHLGEPKPYWGTAHIPIPMGSQAQEVIYEWLFLLRKKGFRDGIMIFERGSGRAGGKSTYDVFEQSVEVLKSIKKYLEQGIEPDKLPLEFYGMSEQNKDVYTRELIAIRDHVEDPLAGVLAVPEEKHTFLSKAAIDKGKGQEWEKRHLR